MKNGMYFTFLKQLIVGFLLLVVLLFSVVIYFTRPAESMDRYEKYYTNDTSAIKKGNVKVTFFGVSTLLLDDGETQLMIDGFFSRPSLFKVITSKIATDSLM